MTLIGVDFHLPWWASSLGQNMGDPLATRLVNYCDFWVSSLGICTIA